jgi:hypothetical protein
MKVQAAALVDGQIELRLGEDGRRLETTSEARLLGATIARARTTTQFEPGTGQTVEYSSYTHKRGRRYLFGDRTYSVEKLKPVSEGDPATEWEVTVRREYPYPDSSPGSTPGRPHDYYGMLLRLDKAGLNAPGDAVTRYVATSKGPQAYRVSVSEARTTDRTFTDLTTGETTTLATNEFRLSVTPADSETDEGFLNMEGEIEIWVEAETKTLLEIVGRVPKVPGKVKLVLSAMG